MREDRGRGPPPRSAPTIAQEISGWRPGVAHREMSVASQAFQKGGWTPERPQKEEVQRGVQGLEFVSHHLREVRCSNWAPSTLGLSGFRLCLEIPAIMSTLGIDLLLPFDFGIGRDDCLSWTKRFEPRVSHVCLQHIVSGLSLQRLGSVIALSVCCPGGGELAGIMTLDGDVAVEFVRVFRLGLGLRNALGSAFSDLFPRSARPGPAGETTATFTFWTFVTSLSVWNSGGRQASNTGSRVSSCIFGLKQVALAYGFDVGNHGVSVSYILGPFFGFSAEAFGWPVGVEPGSCESGCPSGINVDVVSVDVERVVASRGRPVNAPGWRTCIWLKRRGMVVFPAGLGPPS